MHSTSICGIACAAAGHPEWASDPRFVRNTDRLQHRDEDEHEHEDEHAHAAVVKLGAGAGTGCIRRSAAPA